MKLEENMYVRTTKGIVRIEKILDGVMWDTQGHLHFGDFIKASHNIIDLIEVGDYVNGHQVYDDFRLDTDDYGINFIEIGIESDKFLNHYIREDEIKSIVTKEQFESMKYSLEGQCEKCI